MLTIPLNKLKPHPQNPRRHLSAAAIDELAASLKQKGCMTPLLVREHGKSYQVLAGHRRLAAAEKVKFTELPCVLCQRDGEPVNDLEALEILVAENLEREDVDPLDEASGIQSLIDAGWTIEQIGSRFGREEAWTRRRLALSRLHPKFAKLRADADHPFSRAPTGVLELLASLPTTDQQRYADEVEPGLDIDHFMSRKRMALLIASDCMTLSQAPWKLDDEGLVPKQGACAACQRRSDAQPELWSDLEDSGTAEGWKRVARGTRCLDSACWQQKTVAYIERQLADPKLKPDVIFNSHHVFDDKLLGKLKAPVKEQWRYTACKKSDRGALRALEINSAGALITKWVRPSGTMGAGSTPRKKASSSKPAAAKATPLAARRKALQQRRRGLVIGNLRKLLSSDSQKPKLNTGNSAVMRLIAVYGTRRNRADFGTPGRAAMQTFNQLTVGGAVQALWNSWLEVMWVRLNYQRVGEIDRYWHEVELIAALSDWDLAAAIAAAEQELPEPKAWANLKADGRPKTTKPGKPKWPAKRAAKKRGRKTAAKKKRPSSTGGRKRSKRSP